jgi:CheY-like chemotaxis protein
MRLLVVDDDADTVDALRGVLANMGVQSDGASDGLQALQMLERGEYDGMLLGMMMPRMDGLQVLRTLKQATVSLPIVGMTGNPEARQAALNLGLKVCLLKPFSKPDLLRAFHLAGLPLNGSASAASR